MSKDWDWDWDGLGPMYYEKHFGGPDEGDYEGRHFPFERPDLEYYVKRYKSNYSVDKKYLSKRGYSNKRGSSRRKRMENFDNTNLGVIWKNKKKLTNRHPDYTGILDVDGVEHWVSAWRTPPDDLKKRPKLPILRFSITKKEVS